MSEALRPADVFLTRGRGFISAAIRFFSRHLGESRTVVNHVGIVVVGGPVEQAIVIEALSRVRRHRLAARYGGKRGHLVAVYRPLTLSEAERATVVRKAEDYVGRKYGYLAIAAHFLDWLLLGAYLFRRLANQERYPICSWVVASAFAKVGRHFGVAPGAATPDDIWDFVTKHPDEYRLVRALAPLP